MRLLSSSLAHIMRAPIAALIRGDMEADVADTLKDEDGNSTAEAADGCRGEAGETLMDVDTVFRASTLQGIWDVLSEIFSGANSSTSPPPRDAVLCVFRVCARVHAHRCSMPCPCA